MLKLTSSRERRQELKKPCRKNDHCIFPPLTPRGYGVEQWALENMLKNIAPVYSGGPDPFEREIRKDQGRLGRRVNDRKRGLVENCDDHYDLAPRYVGEVLVLFSLMVSLKMISKMKCFMTPQCLRRRIPKEYTSN